MHSALPSCRSLLARAHRRAILAARKQPRVARRCGCFVQPSAPLHPVPARRLPPPTGPLLRCIRAHRPPVRRTRCSHALTPTSLAAPRTPPLQPPAAAASAAAGVGVSDEAQAVFDGLNKTCVPPAPRLGGREAAVHGRAVLQCTQTQLGLLRAAPPIPAAACRPRSAAPGPQRRQPSPGYPSSRPLNPNPTHHPPSLPSTLPPAAAAWTASGAATRSSCPS